MSRDNAKERNDNGVAAGNRHQGRLDNNNNNIVIVRRAEVSSNIESEAPAVAVGSTGRLCKQVWLKGISGGGESYVKRQNISD